MKYVGVDFGLSHLGLAVSEGELAEPLAEKKYSGEAEALQFLSRLCEEQAIEAVVFGVPEGNLAGTIRTFAEKLQTVTGLAVFFQDETLSTIEARQKLLASGQPQKKRRLDHRGAATLILQNYLDSIN